MMFGRKKRPSQSEASQAPSGIAHLGAADEDEDIIELVDIIEIPEDQETEEGLLGLADAALDDDEPTAIAPNAMDSSAIAAILEGDQAEILEDEGELTADAFLTQELGRSIDRRQDEDEAGLDGSVFDGGEFAASEVFEAEKTLMEEADTDRLIAEFMASRQEEVTEEDAVLVVEEFEEDAEEPVLAVEDHDTLKDWDDTEMLTDEAMKGEAAIAETDEGWGQLLEETFGRPEAETAAEILEMTASEVAAVSVEIEEPSEDDALVSPHQEETDARVTEVESELSLVDGFEDHQPSPSVDTGVGTVLPEMSYSVAETRVSPEIGSVFSITAASPVSNDSMMLEEEILFACRPGDEWVEGTELVEPSASDTPDSPSGRAEQLQPEDEVQENVLSLDTFQPVGATIQPISTRELELLDLMGYFENKLLANLQVIVAPDLLEVEGDLVKKELEDLRRLIDHIDATDEFRL
ncbi:MAG TPA: hypothetical protein DEO88_09265 [Syntrophobacteraceae bacterium]|nr:hypothetical protein [Syntrophobacteraceae bacterium]